MDLGAGAGGAAGEEGKLPSVRPAHPYINPFYTDVTAKVNVCSLHALGERGQVWNVALVLYNI